MVVSSIINNFILKYKICTVVLCLLIFLLFSSIVQIADKSIVPLQANYSYSYPIDVVYTWVNGSDSKFLLNLQNVLQINSTTKRDYSSQRFDDKFELKFSLRSIEKFAPWIRHVYIVTNGQIPYWLNLDYEKVSIISHEEIFSDKYDLPTFSSPAIESHLHRIPGLSDHFIYFNDDIFLGAPIFLDDFVSPSRGYLIYLAWPLPMCAIDCPWVYVADGQCDRSCYNPDCQMDGGDCDSQEKGFLVWSESGRPKKNSDEIIDTDFEGEDQMPQLNLKLLQRNSTYSSPQNKNAINNQIFNVLKTNRSKIRTNSKDYTKNNFKTENKNRNLGNTSRNLPGNDSNTFNQPNRVYKNKILKHLNDTKNLADAINRHNEDVMLQDKITRKKRSIQKSLRKKYKKSSFGTLMSLRNSTIIEKIKKAKKVDVYAASLQYANRIYNLKYGYSTRQVPAHAPILINKNAMNDLQATFKKEFAKTSRNKIRSEDDMQYSFSYYYYVIHERYRLNVSEIFDMYDTDGSSTWSDREIRTLLTKVYELPLSYAVVDHFEDLLLNCSKYSKYREVTTPEFERYIDSKLPTVSRDLVVNCPILAEILTEHFGYKKKYKYEIIKNVQSKFVTFVMLNSNISEVVGHLDEIRRHSKKFVCLNDNLDETKLSENELVRAVLYDFYLSFFPNPSKFELPVDFRNRFLYLDELNLWKVYHFKLKVCIYVCIFVLCYFTYCNICKRRFLYRFINKICC